MNIFRTTVIGNALVGLSGLEPPTSRLSGARSNQLSYKPIELQNHSGPEDWIDAKYRWNGL